MIPKELSHFRRIYGISISSSITFKLSIAPIELKNRRWERFLVRKKGLPRPQMLSLFICVPLSPDRPSESRVIELTLNSIIKGEQLVPPASARRLPGSSLDGGGEGPRGGQAESAFQNTPKGIMTLAGSQPDRERLMKERENAGVAPTRSRRFGFPE